MSYSFNVSLLIWLKTNSKIVFLDVFVMVLYTVFQRNIPLYSEPFVQSKKYEELEELFACGFFWSCSISFTLQNPYFSVSPTLCEDSNYNF